MFRHQGKSRNLKHNLRIATVLSFVAGIVNVVGFLAFNQLTTNVTGHFALFINDVAEFKFWKGTIYFLYIFSFLFGSFCSSFLIEKFRENKQLNVYVIPTLIECFILISVGISSNFLIILYPNIVTCLLLFAMGLQNSFVTKISNAVVRTTHLTGLFTDLGIDLSMLLFPKYDTIRVKLKANIKLRIYIILFFFAGGLSGGFFYSKLNLQLNTLIIGAIILLISLYYDALRYKVIKVKRKNYK
ncbi:YoaK family protein [Olleya sp. UBA1516]|uniref:YoaK family protein n=1 Tax=Olleya sp. UBA1516 TaxID=1947013 RepID=UPI0025DE51A8|nr:YoaK family protein [Olleya sp. UBA1516]|tara:strand:- start:1169 stop:1897 length:729 start_codon:yes stop_codon:yes gene_type:complete